VISVRASIQDAIAAIELLYNLEAPIQSAAQLIEQTLLRGNKVLTCGNGGSAAIFIRLQFWAEMEVVVEESLLSSWSYLTRRPHGFRRHTK
jgi:phosphoheptose isomerase